MSNLINLQDGSNPALMGKIDELTLLGKMATVIAGGKIYRQGRLGQVPLAITTEFWLEK